MVVKFNAPHSPAHVTALIPLTIETHTDTMRERESESESESERSEGVVGALGSVGTVRVRTEERERVGEREREEGIREKGKR